MYVAELQPSMICCFSLIICVFYDVHDLGDADFTAFFFFRIQRS